MPRIFVDKDVERYLKQAVERSGGAVSNPNEVLRYLLGLEDVPTDPSLPALQPATNTGDPHIDGMEFDFPPMHPWRQSSRFFTPDHRLWEAETVALKQLELMCGLHHPEDQGLVCVMVRGHEAKGIQHFFYKATFTVHRAEVLEALQEIIPPETEMEH